MSIHRGNRSTIPGWDFPAWGGHQHQSPGHHHWVRTRRRLVPCWNQPSHRCGLHERTHHCRAGSPINREFVTVRRRARPRTPVPPEDRCDRSRWHWLWLWPCFRACRSHGCCGGTRGRTRDRDRSYGPFHTGCNDVDPQAHQDAWGDPGRRRSRRARVHRRRPRAPGPALLFQSPPSLSLLTPPPSLLRPSRSRHRRRGPRRCSEGDCTCPACTGEGPDLVDRLCAGVDDLGLGRRVGSPEVVDGFSALLSSPPPPPNSRLSSRVRSEDYGGMRSRSRRPYWRAGLDGMEQTADDPFLGLLDSASDVLGGDAPWLGVDSRTRGRERRGRRRTRRRSGVLRDGAREVVEETSDFEAWKEGAGGRRAW